MTDLQNPDSCVWEEGMFFAQDHLKLFYRIHIRPGAANTLVILHGHGEHSGRYDKFTRILEKENLNIAAMDLRGSGRSEGREVYVESFQDYLANLSSFIQFLKLRYGIHEKVILLGHSLGGLIAIHWAMEHPEAIKGMILSSPCLGLRLPPLLVRFNDWMNRYFPKFLYQNPVYPPHLTHNPEEVIQYKKDPLIKRKITVRLIDEMLKSMDLLEQKGKIRYPFPVYILSAGMEKVVDFSRTKDFFQKLDVPDKDIVIFDGYYHEIFNELGQEKVFEALKENIRRIAGPPPSGAAR
ncbi:MAG: lysophospholipase [Candidatus Omnitrophica bacterium]|nr:lysophospholipase [Candidatus Omnitrophota bacterium]